ncbi:sodium/hydrogen exchanger [Subtercola lobariae]|uniref:Sodium/hydrogen exchanger n=1 Tax=Subtercola lobariae TaxID=1588641 RepID=A0A917B6V1_9MICO|nr:sodium/hydrogen exchanger [Subtercola lobariae]
MNEAFASLVVVVLLAAAAPLIVDLIPGPVRIPQVALLLVGGVIIGPEVAHLADPTDISLFSTIGMGFLFLLAGYELDPKIFVERAGKLAIWAWLSTLVLAALVVFGLYAVHIIDSPIVLTIALSTTALGTLIPILKEQGMFATKFGRYIIATGAVGELAPIIAMALFLGTRGTIAAFIALVIFLGVIAAASLAKFSLMPKWFLEMVDKRRHSTSQLVLRLVIALLFVLLFVSNAFGFDSVLGAFAAGMLLRHWSPGGSEILEVKLDAVGYGFFIPLFFIYSGMTLDVTSILQNPAPLIIFFVAMLLIRGAPALFWYRNDVPVRERFELTLFGATALPLLVALTEIGVDNGAMTEAAEASIVGAGALSVLIFPMVAVALSKRNGIVTVANFSDAVRVRDLHALPVPAETSNAPRRNAESDTQTADREEHP